MTETPSDQGERETESAGLIPAEMPRPAVFSYNVSEAERPQGVKVRWKVRVLEGAEAARADEKLSHAIRELLSWAARRESPPQP